MMRSPSVTARTLLSCRCLVSCLRIPDFLMHEEIAHLSLALSPNTPSCLFWAARSFLQRCRSLKISTGRRLRICRRRAFKQLYKVMGMEIGRSHVENPGTALLPLLKNEKLILPSDVRVVGRERRTGGASGGGVCKRLHFRCGR